MLYGVSKPAFGQIGCMLALKDSMNEEQIAEPVSYLRRPFAPDKPAGAVLQRQSAELGNPLSRLPPADSYSARGWRYLESRTDSFALHPSQPTFTCGTDHCETAIGSSTGVPRKGADRQ